MSEAKAMKGACQFCGQIHMVMPLKENPTEEELNQMATMMCDCPEAKVKQKIHEMIVRIKDNIDKMSNEDVQKVLKPAVDSIAQGAIEEVTVKIGGGVRFKICRGKDRLRLTKTTTKQEISE